MKQFFISAAGGFVGSFVGCTIIGVTAMITGAVIINIANKIENGDIEIKNTESKV